jgi:hypothetical protein
MRGGYKIIDFNGKALTSGTEATIKGAYEAATNPYGKATLISGLVVGGVSYPEFYAPFISDAGTMEAVATINEATITISVAAGDAVTVTIA